MSRKGTGISHPLLHPTVGRCNFAPVFATRVYNIKRPETMQQTIHLLLPPGATSSSALLCVTALAVMSFTQCQTIKSHNDETSNRHHDATVGALYAWGTDQFADSTEPQATP